MKKLISVFVILLISCMCLYASFLKNIPYTIHQPNGKSYSCFMTGDEFYHYIHDAQNYTIVKNTQTGYYVYAEKVGEEIVPSQFIVGEVNPEDTGLTPNINISAEQWREKRDLWMSKVPQRKISEKPRAVGSFTNIVVFIRFSDDTDFETSFTSVDNMFNDNSENANSVYNYYKKVSYNNLNVNTYFYPHPNGDLILSYQAEHPRSYYEPASEENPNGYSYQYAQEEIYDDENCGMYRLHHTMVEALDYVESMIPNSVNLDANNDDMVDNVSFVFKGDPCEWADVLWPHRYYLFYEFGSLNGIDVWDYNLQLDGMENYFRTSVFCHEMFHTMGAPDLYHYYDSVYNLSAVGPWDLMENTDNPPQQMGAYMKYKYGNWLSEIPEITESGIYTLHDLGGESNDNVAYRISTGEQRQSIILEYRRRSDVFDSTLPGDGLLIYRIDTDYDGNSDFDGETNFDEVYLFRPGAAYHENGVIEDANFSSTYFRTEFSSDSETYPFYTDGSVIENFYITQVSEAGGETIQFYYGQTTNSPIFEKSSVDMAVYPNPTNGKVYVSTDFDNAKIELLDVCGRVVKFDILNNGESNFDIQNLEQGTYFVRVVKDDKQYIKKLIKQ